VAELSPLIGAERANRIAGYAADLQAHAETTAADELRRSVCSDRLAVSMREMIQGLDAWLSIPTVHLL
jgi:hypothetical protein